MVTKHIQRSSATKHRTYNTHHRFEHWYIDNQVYFITARCRDRFPAFALEEAKAVFWDRFKHYAAEAEFCPWVTSMLANHYHTIGYARMGKAVGQMMRKLHGSVAKLVNDLLPERRIPFFAESGHHDYYDGAIRDEGQARKTYRYVLTQSVRNRLCTDWRRYPHTRVRVEMAPAIRRSIQLKAFLEGVRYQRYEAWEEEP